MHALIDQGIQQAQQGDHAAAIATFTQVIQSEPYLAEPYYRRGLSHFKQGSYHAAVFDYTEAINRDRDRMEFYYVRALGRVELRNLSGALEDVESAIRCNLNDAPAYQLKGTIQQKLALRDAAIASFRKAANLYLMAKDPESCRLCVQKLEELQGSSAARSPQPEPIEMLSQGQLLANILKRAEAGEFAQALKDLEWALRADPQDAMLYSCRAIVKRKMGDKQGAIADLNQAIKLNPQDAIVLRNRGKLRLQIGDFLGAQTDLNQAVAINTEDAINYVARGELYNAMGNFQDAMIDFAKAIKLQPDNPEAYLGRAQAYAHQEDLAQAIQDRQIAASQYCDRQDWENYNKVQSLLRSFQTGSSATASDNFAFLQRYESQLEALATLAEKYYAEDPVTCLMKLRQFGECFAQCLAKQVEFPMLPDEGQLELLNRLYNTGYLPDAIHYKLQEIRRIGNQATHAQQGEPRTALKHLKFVWELSIWYCTQFWGDSFMPPNAFIPPEG
jgi:tetratricopeptide (TPR) repeat protein